MKRFFVLCLVLCFVFAGIAQAINWSAPVKVATQTVSGAGKINVAAENGKFGIVYHHMSAAGTWGTVLYNEFTYSAGTFGALTHSIIEEELPGSIVSTWGVTIAGIGLDDGQPVIASVAWSVSNSDARVYTRIGVANYSYVNASPNARYDCCARREAFQR